nr:hypothetical protein [uncultured bacterium]
MTRNGDTPGKKDAYGKRKENRNERSTSKARLSSTRGTKRYKPEKAKPVSFYFFTAL